MSAGKSAGRADLPVCFGCACPINMNVCVKREGHEWHDRCWTADLEQQLAAEKAKREQAEAELAEFKSHHYGGGCGCDEAVPESAP